MNFASIVPILEEADQSYRAVTDKEISEALYVLRSRGHGRVGTDESARLKEAIASNDTVAEFLGLEAHFLGRSRTFTADGLMWWLVSRSHETSPERALEELFQFVHQADFGCHAVLVVANVHASDRIELDDGISLVPFTEVPQSVQKTEVADEGAARAAYSVADAPRAALVKHFRHPKALLPKGEEPPTNTESLISEAVRELDEARLCVAVSGPASPDMTHFWIAPDADVPFYRLGDQVFRYPISRSMYAMESASLDWKARQVHEQFRRLNDATREWLATPMKYLGSAYGAVRAVDVAINLGIAAESMFLREMDRGELRFRLSLRAARFLATTEDDRAEVYKAFTKLYDLRSKAVHSGELTPSVSDREVLKRGLELTAEAIRRVIADGGVDWNHVQFG